MFDDIEEMEKEVDAFCKNMLASGELVESVKNLTTETQDQKDRILKQLDDVIKQMNTAIEGLKSTYDLSFKSLEQSNESGMEALREGFACEQKTAIDNLRNIIEEINVMLEKHEQADYDNLIKTRDLLLGYQAEVEGKYFKFIEKLESTHVDQVFAEMQAMKDTMQKTETAINNKFKFLLSISIVVPVICSVVLGFVLK